MRIQTTNDKQLELTWVQVRDDRGRVHMEARWSLVPVSASASSPSHAA